MREWGWFLVICAAMIAISLATSGCAEAIATAVDDARDLHQSAREYVDDNHDLRRWVREQCLEILKDEIAQLRASGDHEAARAVLIDKYPDLVTRDAVKTKTENLAHPFGC